MAHLAPTTALHPGPPAAEGAPGGTGAPRWRDDRPGLALGLLYAVVVFVPGWLRYANHWAVVDLALFDQGAWLMSRGRAPELTVLDENLFGDHLSPVLVLFAPLYRLVASPLWLLAAQALALGLAVPALRALARQIGASPGLATVATMASAPLLAAATFDVHPVVATVPVTAAALAAAHRDDTRAVTWAAVLVFLIRADASVVLLGVAVLARPRARRRLLALAPVGMAVGVIVPLLLHSDQTFERYWGHLGSSPADALTHPWRVVPALLSESALTIALIWLVPVGLLTLARPRWALATAVAGAPLLLSSAPATALPHFHHAAALVPFVVGGAVLAASDRGLSRPRATVLLAGAALALAVSSPLSPRFPDQLRVPAVAAPRPVQGIDRALAAVEPHDAVAAEVYLLPRLAHRPVVVPVSALGADGRAPGGAAVDVVVADRSRAAELVRLGFHVEVVAGGDLVVARAG